MTGTNKCNKVKNPNINGRNDSQLNTTNYMYNPSGHLIDTMRWYDFTQIQPQITFTCITRNKKEHYRLHLSVYT